MDLKKLYKVIDDEYNRIVNLKLRELKNPEGVNESHIIKEFANEIIRYG
jgi:hypothetical protein